MRKVLILIGLFFVYSQSFAATTSPYILKVYPSRAAYQGNSVIIKAVVPAGIDYKALRIKVFNRSYSMYPYKEGRYRLPLGVKMTQKPGQYRVALYYKGKKKAAFFLTVKKKAYRMTTVRLTKKSKDLVTSKDLIYESNLIGKLFKKIKTALFPGAPSFLRPAKGRITSGFGVGRRYKGPSGKIVDIWRHKGIDFSARAGKKIVAANDGQVILAKMFKAHGGTIMIDHGQGVISIYSHIDNIKVKVGEKVKRGQYIASIGNSGISTGPHLHFGLSVNNVRVNPLQWLQWNMMK